MIATLNSTQRCLKTIDTFRFVAQHKQRLADIAAGVDHGFPDNEHVDFIGDELVIRKHAKEAKPAALDRIDQQIGTRLPPKNILDILVESERWLDLHKLFGPLSGSTIRGYGSLPRCSVTGAIWGRRKRRARSRSSVASRSLG